MLTWLWKRLSDGGPEATVSGRALRRFPEREVDRQLRARVLVERRKADTWPVCAHCDCGIDARPIRDVDGELRACCPFDANEDVVLEPADLRRFGIDADRLVAAIAASGELTGEVTRIGVGIWLAGIASTGRAIVLCRDTALLDAPGTILTIQVAAGRAPVTAIADMFAVTTALRLREAGVDAIDIGEAMIADGTGTDRLAPERIAGSVTHAVTANDSAMPATARLQTSRSHRSVRLDGRDFILSLTEFDCFIGAAEKVATGQVMLTYQEIYALTNRASLRDVINELRDKFQKQGLSRQQAFNLVRTVHGRGLTIGLPGHEIDIRD